MDAQDEELGEAVDIISRLKEENEGLVLNFDSLRSAHVQAQNRCAELEDQLRAAVEANRELGATHDQVTAHLEEQLENRAREVQELRETSLTPRDVDRLRAKVAGEVEREWQRRVREVAEEAERLRGVANASRREAEMAKSQASNREAELQAREREREERQRSVEETLRGRVQALQGTVDDMERERARLAAVRRENIEHAQRAKAHEREMQEMEERMTRANKELWQAQKAAEARSLDAAEVERSAQNAKLEAERRSTSLQQELSAANLVRAQLTERIALLENAADQLRSKYAALNQGLTAELEQKAAEFNEERARWKREREAGVRALADTAAKYEAMASKEQELSETILVREKEQTAQLRKELEAAKVELDRVKRTRDDLEVEGRRREQEFLEAAKEVEMRAAASRAELVEERRRSAELGKELSALSGSASEAGRELERLRSELESKDRTLAEIVRENMELKDELLHSHGKLKDAERDIGSVIAERDRLAEVHRKNKQLASKVRMLQEHASRLEGDQDLLLLAQRKLPVASPKRDRHPEAADVT